MADSINKYASEAEYNSASHGSTPEVSKMIGSVNPVRYDGKNTDTTGSPSVGDAVYLDPDDNVRFISWKNLVPSALGCQLIIVFLPIITSFNHFLYTISGNNTLISDENKCRLL